MVRQDYIHKVPTITLWPSYLIYMIASATQTDEYWHLHCSNCGKMLP